MKKKTFKELQLKNFTQLPNDLMEVLMSSALNNSEVRLLVYIARKTYGFHKDTDGISLSQFENKLEMSRSTITKRLASLQLVGLVRLVKRGNVRKAPNVYQIDTTDYSDKLVRLAGLVRYDKKKLVGQLGHTKENITKEKVNFFSSEEENRIWQQLNTANQDFVERKKRMREEANFNG